MALALSRVAAGTGGAAAGEPMPAGQMVGAGVFYGAAGAEARAAAGRGVFVVGAGNSAGQAAIHLAKYAALSR